MGRFCVFQAERHTPGYFSPFTGHRTQHGFKTLSRKLPKDGFPHSLPFGIFGRIRGIYRVISLCRASAEERWSCGADFPHHQILDLSSFRTQLDHGRTHADDAATSSESVNHGAACSHFFGARTRTWNYFSPVRVIFPHTWHLGL